MHVQGCMAGCLVGVESPGTGGSIPGAEGVLGLSPGQQHHCLGQFTRSPPVCPLNLVKTN